MTQSSPELDPLALAVMAAYCGWDPTSVVAGASTVLDGTGSSSVFLPTLHLTAVASVLVTLDNDGTTYDASAEVRWKANGEVSLASDSLPVFPEGDSNVTIVWSGGYDSVPADLTAALASIGARTGGGGLGLTQARIGTAVLSYAAAVASGGLLAVETMVLDRYRLPRIR